MAAMTKSDLVRINSQLAEELATLRKENTDLRMQVEMHTQPTHRVAPHMARAAAMAAARDMAMRTRMMVKV